MHRGLIDGSKAEGLWEPSSFRCAGSAIGPPTTPALAVRDSFVEPGNLILKYGSSSLVNSHPAFLKLLLSFKILSCLRLLNASKHHHYSVEGSYPAAMHEKCLWPLLRGCCGVQSLSPSCCLHSTVSPLQVNLEKMTYIPWTKLKYLKSV